MAMGASLLSATTKIFVVRSELLPAYTCYQVWIQETLILLGRSMELDKENGYESVGWKKGAWLGQRI